MTLHLPPPDGQISRGEGGCNPGCDPQGPAGKCRCRRSAPCVLSGSRARCAPKRIRRPDATDPCAKIAKKVAQGSITLTRDPSIACVVSATGAPLFSRRGASGAPCVCQERRDSHFDYFLDRAQVVIGDLNSSRHAPYRLCCDTECACCCLCLSAPSSFPNSV
jgi:hypothetical protein